VLVKVVPSEREGERTLPGLDEGDAVVDGDLADALGDLGEQLGVADLLEGDGPVDEVEVEVVELELLEGVIEGAGDEVGVVVAANVSFLLQMRCRLNVRVPQLGGLRQVSQSTSSVDRRGVPRTMKMSSRFRPGISLRALARPTPISTWLP
jgi:hypothetical protein